MNKEKVIEIVDSIFKREFEKKAKVIVNLKYYKNEFLKYAIENHDTMQCVVRVYLELLKTSFLFTGRRFDLWEANELLIYLKLYQNRDGLEYIWEMMNGMEASFPLKDYVIKSFHNRFKSLLSCIAKLRSCEVTEETLLFLKEHLFEFTECKDFGKSAKMIAKNYLKQLWDANYAKTPTKDIIGFREIIYSCNNSRDEADTIPEIYAFVAHVHQFCKNEWITICREKDYIKSPKKDTGYRSYHMTLDVFGSKVELQARNGIMHEHAEYGGSSHNDIYKNTTIQKFLREFLHDVSASVGKISHNVDIGILRCLSLAEMPDCITPNSEVPQTPSKLQEFQDKGFVEEILAKSPKFAA